MDKYYYVYIMSNEICTVLYIGVTGNLVKRVYEHKNKFVKGFTQKYNTTKLVYYESFNSVEAAINREKQLKKWNRQWKNELIKNTNPQFKDLYNEII